MKRPASILIILSALASAQSFEGSVSAGRSTLSGKEIGAGYTLDGGFNLAFRATLNTREHLGYEFGYAYNRVQLGSSGSSQGMADHQGFLETLLYATPQKARIRPFLAGGIHFSNFVPPGQTAQYGQGETKFGINYGGGIKVKIKDPWQFRLDYRQFNTGMPFGLGASGRLLQSVISAGVSYTM